MALTQTRCVGNRVYELMDGIWYLIQEESVPQGDPHALLARALWEMLEELLRDHPLARVFYDICVHWDPLKGDAPVAPDLIVFPRLEPRDRKSIFLWQEASPPIVVIEVLSSSTEDSDLEGKLEKYRDKLRVPEYFVCDPEGRKQRVWGYRLEAEEYRAIAEDDRGRVWSEQLKAWIGPDGVGKLQVWDRTGRQMTRYEKALEERDEALEEREVERQRAEAALAAREAERQRAEAALAAREAERQRAEAALAARGAAMQRADEEARARAAAEARAQELEVLVRRLQAGRNGLAE